MSRTMLDELQARRLGLFNELSQSDTEADRYSDLATRHRDIAAGIRQKIADLDKAISALTPEGKEALLDDQPEPVPTEVRKQDEQDAAVKPYRVYVENSVRGEATSLGFDTSVFALDYAQRMSASGAVTRVHVVEGMSAPNSETIFLWEAPPPPQEAPAIPEDWTRHDGGECPLRAGVDVDLRFRDGSTYFNSIGLGDFRKNWSWDCSEPAQIVAYRENQASAEAERIEDASQGTPSTEQTEHDRPKLTNEEFESLEKIDGVLDAEPSPILRSEVPPAAETYLAPSGDEFATVNGQTHLIVSDEAEAQGQAETAPQAAYAPIHNEDEPSDAAVFAHGLNVEIDQKADNTNPFNPFRLFGGAKKTLVGEGV